MSSAPAVESGDAKKNSPRRRRTPGNRQKRPSGDAPAVKVGQEIKERKSRPESLPVPASFAGRKATGRVTAIVKKGRLRFGFIHIGPADVSEEELPRIYFSFTDVADPAVTIRNKYLVEFECKKDERDRFYASGIALTAEGKIAAAVKEVEFAAAKALREASGQVERPKRDRPPRERKPQEERNVMLRVTCEGKQGEKRLEVNCAASVGKLKNIATEEFDAPLTFNVFYVTNKERVFMTKAILDTLKTDDRVHLGAPVESPVAAKA